MTFNLNLYGDSPVELRALINALADLPGGLTIEHTPSAPHPAQPQNEAVTQLDKPKAPAPTKQKKAAQEPSAAPAEEPANPTEPASAPDEPREPTPAQTAPSEATATAPSAEPGKDPAVLDKLRDLARSLIVQGKRDGVQQAIKSAGAAAISKLPPESYTTVWEQLLKLKDEVDADAAG